MPTVRLDVRVSRRLRRAVDAAGERSAAARALIIAGLAAAGVDVAPLLDEAASALPALVDPKVRTAIHRLLSDSRPTAVRPASDTAAGGGAAEEDAEAADDPYDVYDVGIRV